MPAKAKLRLVAPTHQNRTMPIRPVNADLRKREYLTPHEIEKLIKAARKSGKTDAQGQRNATLVLVAYLVAREVEAWRVNQTEVVRITRELCLPTFKHDPHRPYAWPRSR